MGSTCDQSMVNMKSGACDHGKLNLMDGACNHGVLSLEDGTSNHAMQNLKRVLCDESLPQCGSLICDPAQDSTSSCLVAFLCLGGRLRDLHVVVYPLQCLSVVPHGMLSLSQLPLVPELM